MKSKMTKIDQKQPEEAKLSAFWTQSDVSLSTLQFVLVFLFV